MEKETLEKVLKSRIKTLLSEAEILDTYVVEKTKVIEEAHKKFNEKFTNENTTYEELEPDIEHNIQIARDQSLASMDLTNAWKGIIELVRVANMSGVTLGLEDEVVDKISKVKRFMSMNFEIIDGKLVLRESSEMKSMFDFRVEEEKKRLKEHFNK